MHARRDFFTHSQLSENWIAPKDWFEHERLADIFHRRAAQLSPGSTLALQGGWGVGKTDLLARIFLKEKFSRMDAAAANKNAEEEKLFPIWINPWKQSIPDVISPITSILIDRLDLGDDEKKQARNALLSAGAVIVQKAVGAGLVATGNPIAGGAIMSIPSLFNTYKKSSNISFEWNDPVSTLGETFKALVNKLISPEESEHGNRLIICIDDLDRCPPNAQVQILESITFLAAAGAPVTIYVGLDPKIVATSIMNRYRVNDFDAEQYLAKIFSTRFNLPHRTRAEVERALRGILEEEFPTGAGTDTLHDIIESNLKISPSFFILSGVEIFHDPKLGRARLMRKVMNDLYLFASSKSDLQLRDAKHVLTLMTWLTIANQFPEERAKILKNKKYFSVMAANNEGLSSLIGRVGLLRNQGEEFTHDVRSIDPYLQIAGL